MPFFLTILAKHQAFAPSRPMPLPRKSRSVRVEFCSRASAKAWHGEKWLQKVHEAQIIKISKTKFQAEKPDQTIGGPWLVAHQWCTILICSSFEFELLTLITRLSLKIFSHCDVNDSLATWEINKNTLCIFCIKFLSAHWLHFQVPVSYSLLSYALFSHTIHTKHQAFAPSSPMWLSTKFKLIKVELSLRDSAKAWQEKSGPWVQLLNWSNSGSSQSSLPSWEFVRLLNRWFQYEIRFLLSSYICHIKFARIWSKIALKRYLDLPNKHPNTP